MAEITEQLEKTETIVSDAMAADAAEQTEETTVITDSKLTPEEKIEFWQRKFVCTGTA